MAATLVLAVTAAGVTTDSVTGIDLESADNATNTLANRQANPITVGTNSYEKWIRLKITATPANYVQSFKVWFNSTVDQQGPVDLRQLSQRIATTGDAGKYRPLDQ